MRKARWREGPSPAAALAHEGRGSGEAVSAVAASLVGASVQLCVQSLVGLPPISFRAGLATVSRPGGRYPSVPLLAGNQMPLKSL